MTLITPTTKSSFVQSRNSIHTANLDEKSKIPIALIEKRIHACIPLSNLEIIVRIPNNDICASNEQQCFIIREYIKQQYMNAGWVVKWVFNDDSIDMWEVTIR